MQLQQTVTDSATAGAAKSEDIALQLRIRAEFVEMPGLKLTLPQASRLFHLEAVRCERVLGVLVDRGLLAMRGDAFVRRSA